MEERAAGGVGEEQWAGPRGAGDRHGFCPQEASRLMEKAVTIDSKRNFNKGDKHFFLSILVLGIAESFLLVREWRHRKMR